MEGSECDDPVPVAEEEESDHDDDHCWQEVPVVEESDHGDDQASAAQVVVEEESDHVADDAEPYHSKMLHRALQVKSTSSFLLIFKIIQ